MGTLEFGSSFQPTKCQLAFGQTSLSIQELVTSYLVLCWQQSFEFEERHLYTANEKLTSLTSLSHVQFQIDNCLIHVKIPFRLGKQEKNMRNFEKNVPCIQTPLNFQTFRGARFGHGPGGVQIMEPAATNIVTTDSIRRFGGGLVDV